MTGDEQKGIAVQKVDRKYLSITDYLVFLTDESFRRFLSNKFSEAIYVERNTKQVDDD